MRLGFAGIFDLHKIEAHSGCTKVIPPLGSVVINKRYLTHLSFAFLLQRLKKGPGGCDTETGTNINSPGANARYH